MPKVVIILEINVFLYEWGMTPVHHDSSIVGVSLLCWAANMLEFKKVCWFTGWIWIDYSPSGMTYFGLKNQKASLWQIESLFFSKCPKQQDVQ